MQQLDRQQRRQQQRRHQQNRRCRSEGNNHALHTHTAKHAARTPQRTHARMHLHSLSRLHWHCILTSVQMLSHAFALHCVLHVLFMFTNSALTLFDPFPSLFEHPRKQFACVFKLSSCPKEATIHFALSANQANVRLDIKSFCTLCKCTMSCLQTASVARQVCLHWQCFCVIVRFAQAVQMHNQ